MTLHQPWRPQFRKPRPRRPSKLREVASGALVGFIFLDCILGALFIAWIGVRGLFDSQIEVVRFMHEHTDYACMENKIDTWVGDVALGGDWHCYPAHIGGSSSATGEYASRSAP